MTQSRYTLLTKFAIGASKDVTEVDIRTSKPSFTIKNAHEISVRDIDYNPNKPSQLATCGDDCVVRIWVQVSDSGREED
jgi:WD40 repeat protein